MIDLDLLKEIDKKDFTKIFDFLDKNFLKRKLIEYGKKQMKGSKYYIGNRMGSFWNGFSKLDKIPDIKIKTFYKEEIRKGNIEVIKIFNDAILHKLNLSDQSGDIDTKELQSRISVLNNSEVATILFQLFKIDSDITYEQYIFNKNEIIKQYEEKIRENEELYNRTIADMKDKNEDEIKKVSILTKDIEEKNKIIKELKIENEKYINQYKEQLEKNNFILNSLSTRKRSIDDIVNSISSIIEEKNIGNISQLKESCLELLKNNVVNFSKDEDITDNLVIEYIIIKLMEEIKNGYANDKR